MKHIPLPQKFTVNESDKGKKAQVVIEPVFPGYGLTLGNALRRVILSSLPGGAITAVKIAGVSHEFSAMENVSDDVVDIILDLKKLRFKVNTDEPVILHLKTSGEKKVTGADIEANSDAECINKDFVITSLNDKDAKMDMELTVMKGVGYSPVEEREENDQNEIGKIAVDAIFTPVVNVGLSVEATRVGQKTDYDKIVLDIETDGTISPEESVQKAAEILVNQFSWIIAGERAEIEPVELEAPVEIPAEVQEESEAEEKIEEIEEAEEETKKRGRPKKEEESEE